jgi:V-type H+-transporting ATPase subunit C
MQSFNNRIESPPLEIWLQRAKMPSDLSYWLISAPLKDGDPNQMLEDVRNALGGGSIVFGWEIPELKAGSGLNHFLTLTKV